ncbi:hypothetical protein A1O1_05816 [Capronia coronata CBS 617.96]|uniref:Uncharacterized protein n=1 Tax=Capronia coronata CBS 617.96 TaxID=1182541 RepID=W9XY52_9EURO|nr:uncharacterized protein A1O1_05816 [Capronia coronata CBS 617.96]EXJ85452.1 hypothetical protein A1O1_05816 [Capronia coronata CBS 617.96]
MAEAFRTTHGQPFHHDGLTALPQLREQAIPQRSSSLSKSTRPLTAGLPPSTKGHIQPVDDGRIASTPNAILPIRRKPIPSEVAPKGDSGGELSSSPSSASARSTSPPQASSSTTSQRTPRHFPLAPNDPSPLNPLYHIPSTSTPGSKHTMSSDAASSPTRLNNSQSNEHFILPPGFRPGKSARTYVEETILPAVTQEVVKNQTTEIVQENIIRHIHVHHYYTYVQPIRAVEILPARHFVIDEKTGQKVEVAAPEGWEMPTSMQPTKPDLSGLEPESRHYLVDEEHPKGVSEPPPTDEKPKSPQELKSIARVTHATKWSPFPKA